MDKVEYFIRLDNAQNCKEVHSTNIKENYRSVEEISFILDVKKMVIEATYNLYKVAVEPDSIIILGHQVDKSIETLYIVAKYNIQNVEQIGVFILNVSDNVLRFRLSSFVTKQQ